MKVIIAGGRDFKPRISDFLRIKEILLEHKVTEIVSGGARGADAWGEFLGEKLGIPVKRFPADWDRQGKSAGPRRNQEMAEYADAVILMPGGRGTQNMREEASKKGLLILWDSQEGD